MKLDALYVLPKLSSRTYSKNKYQPKPKLAFDATQFSIYFSSWHFTSHKKAYFFSYVCSDTFGAGHFLPIL